MGGALRTAARVSLWRGESPGRRGRKQGGTARSCAGRARSTSKMSARNLLTVDSGDDEGPTEVRPVVTDGEAVVVRSSRTLNMELTCPVCLVR